MVITIEKLFIKFEGKDIRTNSVPIDYLGNLLRSFQAYFRKIIQIKYPKVKKEWTRLVLTEINEGSAITTIELKNPESLMENTFEGSKDMALKIFDAIQEEDEKKALEDIRGLIKKKDDRIDLFQSIKPIWSIKKITTSIGSGYSYKDAKYIILKRYYKPRIHKWLKMEYYKRYDIILGFLTRIRSDEEVYFTIKDENGDFINVYYNLEDLDKYKELLTKTIKLKGKVEIIGNQRVIKNIESIEEIYEITIQKTPHFKLTKPLTFNIEYFEDGILLTEPYIPLNLALDKLSDLEEDLQEYLNFLKETYIDKEIKDLTPKAKDLRFKLINLLNLEES